MDEIYTMEGGWRKVNESGGTLVTAILYNILTGEQVSIVTRDYDYSDCSRDNEYWYAAQIDHDAQIAYFRKNAIIYPGAAVLVVKGRKIPVGTVGTVEKIRPVYDCYRRHVADYVVFPDGQQTNIDNCIMIL